MSIIKSFDSKIFGGKLNVEFYHSAAEVADDLEVRTKTNSAFKDNVYEDPSWVGANREQTYEMLRTGYQPTVDAIKGKLKVRAVGKRYKSYNDVQGFAPVVPNAILGLPHSMINLSMLPIKAKVIDVYYNLTVHCGIDSDKLIKAGQKMLGAILEMERQGYRFNLYILQDYYEKDNGCDMLVVRVKSANQPFDLKRMSFPSTHTAFFRGIGFDWYSKFPLGKYRFRYGCPISRDHEDEEIQAELKRLFGGTVIYFDAQQLVNKGDDADNYVKEAVLTNDRPQR